MFQCFVFLAISKEASCPDELLKEAFSSPFSQDKGKAIYTLGHPLSILLLIFFIKWLGYSIPATEGWGGPDTWHSAEIVPHKNVPAMLQQL